MYEEGQADRDFWNDRYDQDPDEVEIDMPDEMESSQLPWELDDETLDEEDECNE